MLLPPSWALGKKIRISLLAVAAFPVGMSVTAWAVVAQQQLALCVALTLVAGAAVLLSWMFSTELLKEMAQQVGTAVDHVQNSSRELQTCASQQVTSAQELAAATTEITTTIKELLATSRQISESAQRVAKLADHAASDAGSGDQIVKRAQDALVGIKRQVDLIVTHMLDLGKKSQQIGGMLDLINELAEQTNILAINATIESVGAGEAGKRFAVVADEIRKLADRVAGFAREIRGIIDEIRAAANTTIMATEDGSKAVDAGAKQFSEVVTTFRHIAERVTTMSEAAREIELSTKQQTTAVEQVNVAISDVAMAARETETNSGQTLQTSSELAQISDKLTSMVLKAA